MKRTSLLSSFRLPFFLLSPEPDLSFPSSFFLSWSARNTRFDAGWTLLGSPSLTPQTALALVSTNLEKLLGLKGASKDVRERDWIAVEGDAFGFNGKVVASGGAGGKRGEGVALW